MPYLGDYIGHLLSEITIARMQADIEAVRVAELYAGHPLLRHMPVPHFRLPNVEVDAPVVIKRLEEPQAGATPRGVPTPENLRKAFDTVLKHRISEEGIRLKPKHENKLKAVLDEKMVALTQPIEVSIDTDRVANELSNASFRALTEFDLSDRQFDVPDRPIDPARLPKFEEKLKEELRVAFLKLRKPPTRLHVLVTSTEIREAGPSEVITRLHLKISEEGFEWTTIESDGQKQDHLVME
jgi:hypothetical protein